MKKDDSFNRGVENSDSSIVPIELIENKIFLIRGQKVMIDRDLASLYCVATRDLNKAVNRNIDRFPDDFMLSLSKNELENLKFHFGTSSWGGTRKLPRAFTEHGVLMLSSVLRSKRAINVNIIIMRAFIRLRQMISKNKELEQKLYELEHKVGRIDDDVINILNAIRHLMKEEEKPCLPAGKAKSKIGFLRD